MSQHFSLYRQILELHARLFNMPAEVIPARVAELARRFELDPIMEELPVLLATRSSTAVPGWQSSIRSSSRWRQSARRFAFSLAPFRKSLSEIG